MIQEPTNPYAFPLFVPMNETALGGSQSNEGMTLRDYFAGQALIALCMPPSINVVGGVDWSDEGVAKSAYKIADAMLKERAAA